MATTLKDIRKRNKKPNKLTMAAIKEAKRGKELPQVDTSSVEAMIRSILG